MEQLKVLLLNLLAIECHSKSELSVQSYSQDINQ